MANYPAQNPRAIASQALNRAQAKGLTVSAALASLLIKTDRPQQATDIAYGTMRNLRAIDNLIQKLAGRKPANIQKKILTIVRIGIYELVYHPSTPEYSVVDQAVELTKTVGGKKQAGFVNAVLRSVLRAIVSRDISLERAQVQNTLARDLSSGCEFGRAILPDVQSEPVEYYHLGFSLPKFVIAQWLEYFGAEKTGQIAFACNRRPSIYLRPNPLKIEQMQLWANLLAADIQAQPLDDWPLIRLVSPADITALPGFAEGHFTVQDFSAYQPVALLGPSSGKKILDFCSAPGTKTTQLAEAAGDGATIIATDIDSGRLEKVRENVKRLGHKSIEVVDFDEFHQRAGQLGPFDYILLDVPCSNTGVFARRVEARYRVTKKAIAGITKTQRQLLEIAASLLAPGGMICYSTCALLEVENHGMVRDFLKHRPEFRLEADKLTVPTAQMPDHDGGYAAILSRKDDS